MLIQHASVLETKIPVKVNYNTNDSNYIALIAVPFLQGVIVIYTTQAFVKNWIYKFELEDTVKLIS